MNTPQMRKLDIFQNYASMRASPEKYHKPNPTTPNSESIIKTNSSSNLKIASQNFNQAEKKIIQWRKNADPRVVGVKNCQYSTIRTAKKLIQIPTTFHAEKLAYKLQGLKELSMENSIFILNSLLEGYQAIKAFLGYIAFELNFCGIGSNGRVKVWINSDMKKNTPEGKVIRDESEAVLKIIQEMKKISINQFSQFYCYYLRNARKNICDFKYTISIIKSYCSCTKLLLPSKINLKNQNSFSKTDHTLNISPIFIKKRTQPLNSPEPKQPQTLKKEKSQTKLNAILKKSFSENKIIQFQKQKKLGSYSSVENARDEEQKKSKSNSQIANQFNLTLSPSKYIKKSSTSTTNNTRSNGNSIHFGDNVLGLDWTLKTFNKMLKFPTYRSQDDLSNKVNESFEDKVDELFEGIVEDYSNEISPQKQSPSKREESVEKKQQIIRKNHWTPKIHNLFGNTEVKESKIIGKEPQVKYSLRNTQKLDKWARIIAESTIPSNQKNY